MTIRVKTCILFAGDDVAKYLVVDFRMRQIEKEYLKNMGYEIIENEDSPLIYDEVCAHPDMYYTKINDKIYLSKDKYILLKDKLPFKVNMGFSEVKGTYPQDVLYNVCIMGKNAIHNFKFTDLFVKKYLEEQDFNLIDVKQGYSKCSICVVDDNSCIVSDISIATTLLNNNIDVLYVSEKDIKLLRRISATIKDYKKNGFEYSDMEGFIGGAMVRLEDKMIVFGDEKKLSNYVKIKKFIENKGLELVGFENLDIIDYGAVVEVTNE